MTIAGGHRLRLLGVFKVQLAVPYQRSKVRNARFEARFKGSGLVKNTQGLSYPTTCQEESTAWILLYEFVFNLDSSVERKSLCCTFLNDMSSLVTTISFPQVLYICTVAPPCGPTASRSPTTTPRRPEVRSAPNYNRLHYKHQHRTSITPPWSH